MKSTLKPVFKVSAGMVMALAGLLLIVGPVRLVASGGGSVPTNGLALWLRADAGIQQGGDGIYEWVDQSGNQHHAEQPVASSQPTLILTNANGMPAVRFDGLNDFLRFQLPVNGLTGLTLVLVAANTQNQTGGFGPLNSALFWNETQSWGTVYLSPFPSSVALRFGTTQPGNLINYARPASVGSAFTVTTAIKNGSTDSLYVNGALVLSESGKLPTLAGSRDTGNLGRGYDDNTFFGGEIAEVLVYTRALVPGERLNLEEYLNLKYSVSGPAVPKFVTLPMTNGVVGVLYDSVISASGNPAPSYRLDVGPAGMAIDALTGELLWMPTVNQVGNHPVTVTATNEVGSARLSFVITVAQCPPGLVSYWPLEREGGLVYWDALMVNPASCYSVSCPTSVTGIVGNALQFSTNPVNRLSALAHPSLDFGVDESFTLEIWARTENSEVTAYLGRVDRSNLMEYSLGQNTNARPWFYLRDCQDGKIEDLIDPHPAPSFGTWRHVVGVRDKATETASLYVDGELVASRYTTGVFSTGFTSTNATFDIGWINLDDGYQFEGCLDEPALYRRALSGAEIQAHYQLGMAGSSICTNDASPPEIIAAPSDQTIAVGAPATFQVEASGTVPLAYQWRCEGTNLPGVTGAQFVLAAATPADNGTHFAVVVSNAFGVVTSAVARLTVLAPPTITQPPASAWVAVCTSAEFAVEVDSALPLHYQWWNESIALAGETNAVLTFANVEPAHAGLYWVTVSNAVGVVTSTAAALVVIDLPPAIVCPSDQIFSADPGQCSRAGVPYTANAEDSCPGVAVTCTPPSGATFMVGTHVVTCVATDAAGNTNSCTFTVTVKDPEAPAMNCPTDLVLSADAGQCSRANVRFTATAQDNCAGNSLACTPPSGSTFMVGTHVVTCAATDAAGNTNACAFTIVVNDAEPPAVSCPADLVLSADAGQCSRSNVTYTVTPADNCEGVTLACTPPSDSTFAVGTHLVTCVVTDAAGNTNGCAFTITVRDEEAPALTCPASVVLAPDGDQPSRSNVTFHETATDNCGGVSVVCVPPSGSTFPLGTNEVICTAADTAGNTNMCAFTIVVWDTDAPVITCPADEVFSVDPGQCARSGVNYTANAVDNRPGVTVVCVPPSGSAFGVGTNRVTCTATDAAGNTDRCTFSITVRDTEPPQITCPADTVVTAEAGQCSRRNVTFVPTVSDNCPGATLACLPPSGSAFPVGTNVVTCTVTDAAHNVATCSFTVEVEDQEPPSIQCPPDMEFIADAGQCSRSNVAFAVTASDRCLPATVTCQPPSGATFPVGTNWVECTATDAMGNSSVCLFTVTVTDQEPPVITCPADIVLSEDAGQGTRANVTFAPAVSDNCSGVRVVCEPPSGSTFPLGTTLVACQATDASGATATGTFAVTIWPSEVLFISCPPDTTVCTEANATTVPLEVSTSANAQHWSCVPELTSLFPLGTTAVLCTAEDAQGNQDSCGFLVTVRSLGAARLSVEERSEGVWLSWPGLTCTPYVLQQTTRLGPAADWLPVEAPATLSNGWNHLVLPLDSAGRFFRLRGE